jgi:PBP1b-binding outer membrane lipoprotein LpoB
MNKKITDSSLIVLLIIFLSGCATTHQQVLDSDASQVQLRSIQTRAFDSTDKRKMLRTIIATLQDLGFVIDKADLDLGTVSATKLNKYALKVTVSVRHRGEKQLLVRANAQYGVHPVYDPVPYQKFFTSLGKALFLEAQEV